MRAGAETTLACSPEANSLRAKAKRNVLPTLRNLWTAGAARWNRDEPNALRTDRDEPSALRAEIMTNRTTHPLEARGTKKRYLSKLSSLHLQPACPTSWWEDPAHANRKNQKSKQASANLPYLPTRCEARTGLGGREKFSEPKRRTFHAGERTMNGRQPRKRGR